LITEWYGHDFAFVTEYPVNIRPFTICDQRATRTSPEFRPVGKGVESPPALSANTGTTYS
jgi:hypothetical protein